MRPELKRVELQRLAVAVLLLSVAAIACQTRRPAAITDDCDATRIWLPKDRTPIEDHPGVWGASFGPRGRIAVAYDDGTVRLWSADGTEVLAVLRGHDGPVRTAAWSRDGQRVITASEDRTVRIWDARSAAEIDRQTHERVILAAVESDDARSVLVLTCGQLLDKTVAASRIWWGTGTTALLVRSSRCRNPMERHGSMRLEGAMHYLWYRPWKDRPSEWKVGEGAYFELTMWAAALGPGDRLAFGNYRNVSLMIVKPGPDFILGDHPHRIHQATFSPDGERLVTVGYDVSGRWAGKG